MTKKKKNSLLDMIIGAIGLVTAVLAFISLAFEMINVKMAAGIGGLGGSKTEGYKLSDWQDTIDSYNKINSENIGGWNLARVMLIVTLVLVGILAVALLLKFLLRNKILNWLTLVVSVVCLVSAVVFLVATLVGCHALSNGIGNNLFNAGYEYRAALGVYCLTIGAAVTAVMAAISSRHLK